MFWTNETEVYFVEDVGLIKTCWNCSNNGGDKTDHLNKNPCTNCSVQDAFGFVNLVPKGCKINWIPSIVTG